MRSGFQLADEGMPEDDASSLTTTAIPDEVESSAHKIARKARQFVIDCIAGGASAGAAKTIFAPLDRVKILLQTQDSNPAVIGGSHARFKGAIAAFQRIYREQGLRAFWRGNTAAVLRSFPTQALNFGFWGLVRPYLPPKDSPVSATTRVALNTAGGALAGALTTVIVYPLDVARARMAADLAGKGQQLQSKTIIHCLSYVMRNGGVSAVYQGIAASLLGVAVYRGLYFGLFESFKQLRDLHVLTGVPRSPPTPDLPKLDHQGRLTWDGAEQGPHEADTLHTGTSNSSLWDHGVHDPSCSRGDADSSRRDNPADARLRSGADASRLHDANGREDPAGPGTFSHEAHRLGWQWLCAQAAAVCAGMSAYPFDSIRHRMMVQAASKHSMYSSSWDCARKVWMKEGAAGFYRGVGLSVVGWCGAAMLLVLHDEVHHTLEGNGHSNGHRNQALHPL